MTSVISEKLPTPIEVQEGVVQLLPTGRAAFSKIIDMINNAESSLRVHAFVWRDDVIGNKIAKAIHDAAERGVAVSISKDRIAAAYEYSAGSYQSFFHKKPKQTDKFQAWFLGKVYRRKNKLRPVANSLSTSLLKHPKVDIVHQNKRFDHTKVFVADKNKLILGSMGIGDAHHTENAEMAVYLEGKPLIDRYTKRTLSDCRFETKRKLDFLVHTKFNPDYKTLLSERLALIANAKQTLHIEMAYLGDARYTRAIIKAVQRGVQTTIVTSKADVLGNLNLGTCHKILKRTGFPSHLKVFIRPKMVHTKTQVVDGEITDLGSANFTPLSHGVYDEINVLIKNKAFSLQTIDAIESDAKECVLVDSALKYRRLIHAFEKAIVGYQSRPRIKRRSNGYRRLR